MIKYSAFSVLLLLGYISPSQGADTPLAPVTSTVPSTTAWAQGASITVPIWPTGKMPEKGAIEAEAVKESRDQFTRITNVSDATLSVFPARTNGKPAPAVIICPGGAYSYVVVDKEGTEIAAWLNTLGVTGIVLKYRNPNNREGAILDAQRAVRVARSRAKEWNLDTSRIGVMGFSAGGHLAARLSTNGENAGYAAIDEVDKLSCRPDFAVLVYPAFLMRQGQLAPELPISKAIPPMLLIHSEDDAAFVPGTKAFSAALTQVGAPSELVVYQTGGHGYGLRSSGEAKVWPQRCAEWLGKIGVIASTNVRM